METCKKIRQKKYQKLCNQSDTRCRQQAASGAYNILFVITHLLSWMTGNHKFITKQPMSIKICTGDWCYQGRYFCLRVFHFTGFMVNLYVNRNKKFQGRK